jgi:hypothetical protein
MFHLDPVLPDDSFVPDVPANSVLPDDPLVPYDLDDPLGFCTSDGSIAPDAPHGP